MTPNPALGVLLHAIGGFAAGSFYAPLKKVRGWAWESSWLVMGIGAWVISPWAMAYITTPRLGEVIAESLATLAPAAIWSFVFGLLWGVGSLTFGLSVRYLGMALGYALALGFCAVFGTVVPPVYEGLVLGNNAKLNNLVATPSGWIVLGGIGVCALGIAICGWAGKRKEREMEDGGQQAGFKNGYSFGKGLAVAFMAGLLSACFSFGLAAGAPIAELSVAKQTNPLYSNNAVLLFILAGGLITNCSYCLFLNARNRTFGDYAPATGAHWGANTALALLSGVIWYNQFFFYGMGTTKLGKEFDFSSWTLHMAFIIIFSNLWGIAVFKEWTGARLSTRRLAWLGIAVLIASTVVVGYGNYCASEGKSI